MKILFEDYYILVIEKPAGLSSESGKAAHPSAEREALFYVTAQLQKSSTSTRLKVTPYLRVAHRLDRPAGGVLVMAKTKGALSSLMDQFEKGEVKKSYLAWTEKKPPAEEGTLSGWLKRDETGKKALIFDQATRDSQVCSLHYKVLKVKGNNALLELHPNTGRYHQIRAQLAHIGCPIVGDSLYGGHFWQEHQIKLLAKHLAFKHPKSEEPMTFEAAEPEGW